MNILDMLPPFSYKEEVELINFFNARHKRPTLLNGYGKIYWPQKLLIFYGYLDKKENCYYPIIEIRNKLVEVYQLASQGDAKANLCLGQYMIAFLDEGGFAFAIPFLKKAYPNYKADSALLLGKVLKQMKNYDLALLFFNEALKEGDIEAYKFIGMIYCDLGEKLKGVEYYLKFYDAVEADHSRYEEDTKFQLAETTKVIGEIYKSYGMYEESFRAYLKQSDVFSNTVAEAYFNGLGVEKDYKKALFHYRKAFQFTNLRGFIDESQIQFDNHYPRAIDKNCYKLSQCFYYGLGVKKDIKKAEFYFYLSIVDNDDYEFDYDDFYYSKLKPHLTFLSDDIEEKIKKHPAYFFPILNIYKRVNGREKTISLLSKLKDEQGQIGDDAAFLLLFLTSRECSLMTFNRKENLEQLEQLYNEEGFYEWRRYSIKLSDHLPRYRPFYMLSGSWGEEFVKIANYIISCPPDYLKISSEYLGKEYFKVILENLALLPFESGKRLYEILLCLFYCDVHKKEIDEFYGVDAEKLLFDDLNAPLRIGL